MYPAPLADQYAWWLLEAIMQQTQAQLLAQDIVTTNDVQQHEIDRWLHALINEHMPIQYLIGTVPFGSLELYVEPPVVIPRPETEEWCLWYQQLLQPLKNAPLNILDLCSGTGCISLSLAKALPNAHIYAVDISEKALALGRKNAWHNNITNIEFIHSDLFENVPKNIRFDAIISNPPYISYEEWQTLDASVTQWEDANGLAANDDGFAIIKKIITQAPQYLNASSIVCAHAIPQLVIEIGYKQGHHTAHLMTAADFIHVTIRKDLEGKDRVVYGSLEKNESNSKNSA